MGRWNVVLFAVLLVSVSGTIGAYAEDAFTTAKLPRDCRDCPEMVVVPAGEFLMGSSEAETARDLAAIKPFGDMPPFEATRAKGYILREQPQHVVKIDRSFALGKYPVTRQEFAAFVSATGYAPDAGCTLWIDHKYPMRPDAGWQSPGFTQTDGDPVVCVSWRDAEAYISWLNSKMREEASSSGSYRLPSEAEWEYAARANTHTARWWGDPVGVANANCDGCGSAWDTRQTSPVGAFAVNPFGLADILGNAWEWTADCWSETYAGAPVDGSSRTAEPCSFRTMRGGSWTNYPWLIRSANRSRETVDSRTNYIGFRVAKTIKQR